MRFKNQLLDNVVTPNLNNRLSTAKGQVTSYNSENNTASIFIKNIDGLDNYTLTDVPVQLSGVGLRSKPLSVGDSVYVQFNNNSIFQPKIVGFADEFYRINTRKKEKHLRKGTLITNEKELEIDITPSSERWLDYDSNLFKYNKYRYENPVKDVSILMSEQGFFKDNEIALYNPKSSSVVKVKDNGIIDIFVSTNIGIRVNPTSKQIEIFGDLSTNSDKWSVLSNNINIKSYGELSIECEDLNIKSKNIEVNGEKYV